MTNIDPNDAKVLKQKEAAKQLSTAPPEEFGEAAVKTEQTWWHYLIVRKELSGGPLLAQLAHAAGYSAAQLGAPLPERTRVCVLSATKEQFGEIYGRLSLRSDLVGKTLYAMYETEGQLSGSYTAMGFLTSDKQSIIEVIGHLKPWRKE
jgi:hypothetical protein